MIATIAAPAEGDDPFAMFSGWDGGQLLWLALLVPVAVLVFSVGARRVRSQVGLGAILPRGRDRGAPRGGPARDETWRATVERLEARVPTPIARAQNGPVRIEAVIVSSTGNLGGTPGRECVWRNRAGAGPQTAVASELLIVRDDSGCCGVEEPERAHVIAPVDKLGAHHESMSLYVGDRIEVIGGFEREGVGESEDPTQQVYGTLGTDGRLDIRVLERPTAKTEAPRAEAPEPEAKVEAEVEAKPEPEPEPDDSERAQPSSSPHAPEPEP